MGNNETIMLENVYMTDENGKLIPFAYTVIVKTHLSLKERINSFIKWIKFKLFLSKKYKFTAEIKGHRSKKMEKYKTKKVMVEQEEKCDSKTICNNCGKLLVSKGVKKNEYYEITTHTRCWGNDNIDSYEEFDICKDCFQKFMQLVNDGKLEDEEIGIKTNGNVYTDQYDCIDIKEW